MKIYVVWSQFTPDVKEIYGVFTNRKKAEKAVEEQTIVHRWLEEWKTVEI